MLLLMPESQLLDLTVRQLTSFYPIDDGETAALEDILPLALARCEACFSHVRNKYYSDGEGNTRFSPFHGCQHSFFLYTLSRLLFERGGGLPPVRQAIRHSTVYRECGPLLPGSAP